MDDILEDSFDQISSFNIIHRGIHARSATDIKRSSVGEDAPGVPLLWNDYDDGIGNFNIHFKLDDRFSHHQRREISKAMEAIEDDICIRFVNVTNDHKKMEKLRASLVFIQKGPDNRGCQSYVGRGRYERDLILSDECFRDDGVVLHELVHLLGFRHEHTRIDRDEQIKIQFDNIQEGKEKNFDKDHKQYSWLYENVPYDTNSITHYDGHTFSREDYLPTIVDKKTLKPFTSQRKGLSSMDIWKTCKAYKCQRCAGKRIQTYEKSSITDYMNKCSGDNDNYFWSKRCGSDISECPNNDDMKWGSKLCPTSTQEKNVYRGIGSGSAHHELYPLCLLLTLLFRLLFR